MSFSTLMQSTADLTNVAKTWKTCNKPVTSGQEQASKTSKTGHNWRGCIAELDRRNINIAAMIRRRKRRRVKVWCVYPDTRGNALPKNLISWTKIVLLKKIHQKSL